MIRLFSFALVVVVACTGPVWLFALAMLVYALAFTAPELIVVALLVDALFMNSVTTMPLYTIATVLVLIVLELIKPLTVLKTSSQSH